MKKYAHLRPGTRNLTFTVEDASYEAIMKLASISGMKLGAYMREVVRDVIGRQVIIYHTLESTKALIESVEKRESSTPAPVYAAHQSKADKIKAAVAKYEEKPKESAVVRANDPTLATRRRAMRAAARGLTA
jgi:hypothetical protein